MPSGKLLVLAGAMVLVAGAAIAQSDGDNGPNEALVLSGNARLENRSISPDGDQDWLTFALGAPTTVAVETNRRPAEGLAMNITIRDDQLNEVFCETFSCDSEALAIDLPAGQFYIVLEALTKGLTVPNYFVAVSFHPIEADDYEPDNAMGQATPIPNATISRNHSIGPVDDDDWFSYQTLAGSNPAHVVMEGNSGVRQITFEVFESDGDPVFLGKGFDFVPQNRLYFGGGLLPDTYFIRVREWERLEFNDSQAVPNYQFTVWDISQPDPYEDDDTPATASAVQLQGADHTPAGHQQYRNIMPQGDVDWVRFYVEDADEVIVRAFADVGPDTTVAIYNNTGQVLLSGPESGSADLNNPADGYYLARISVSPSQDADEHLYDLDITSIPIPRLTPGSLSGVVFSGSKQSPLANATVTVSGQVNVSASTDNAGIYLVPTLPQGAYTVRATAPGFAMGQTQANVGPAITAADIALEPSANAPEDIDGSGTVDAVDVQLAINGALGTGPPADVNNDGETDAVDVQLVINAALGL